MLQSRCGCDPRACLPRSGWMAATTEKQQRSSPFKVMPSLCYHVQEQSPRMSGKLKSTLPTSNRKSCLRRSFASSCLLSHSAVKQQMLQIVLPSKMRQIPTCLIHHYFLLRSQFHGSCAAKCLRLRRNEEEEPAVPEA